MAQDDREGHGDHPIMETMGGGSSRLHTHGGGEAMRWLILPDIHDKLRRANQIIEREPHDRLLLLGDFFDDFRTGVTDAADTASQVKKWLNDQTTTCLLGNHDMSYGWCRQNRRLICPGYDAAKWITINATVTNKDWQKFALHAWLESEGSW